MTIDAAADGESSPDTSPSESATRQQPRRRVEVVIIIVVVLASLGVRELINSSSEADAADAPSATTAEIDATSTTTSTDTTTTDTTDTIPTAATDTPETTDTPDSVATVRGTVPHDTAAETAPTSTRPTEPLPSAIAWIDVTPANQLSGHAAECAAEQRTVFVGLEEYAARNDTVPAHPDALVGAGQLEAHPDSWSARWAFSAIGDATYVVATPGGACDR